MSIKDGIEDIDFGADLSQAVLWQYDSAQEIIDLIAAWQAWFDRDNRDFWLGWFKNIFDPRTINEFGVQIWAIILELPIRLRLDDTGIRIVWGYADDDGNYGPWDKTEEAKGVNYWPLAVDPAVKLSLEDARKIIKLRYYNLTGRMTTYEISSILVDVFGDGAGIIDNQDMSIITYRFTEPISSGMKFIIENSNIMPRPSAVGVNYILTPDHKGKFGFAPFLANFDNGNFYKDN